MKSCKNCDFEFDGNFCPNCGQKYIDQRFTLRDSFNWLINSVFNLDHGFIPTTVQLITKPGKTINEYLKGITIRYSHPFRFMFIWATISAILGAAAGSFEDSGVAINEAMGVDEQGLDRTRFMMKKMNQYMNILIMLMIPFYALGSYLLFRKAKNNYAEHLIINAYAISSSVAIGLPFVMLYFYYPHNTNITTINFIIGVIVVGRIYTQTFKTNYFLGILKYLISMIIGLILFTISFALVMIIGAIISVFLFEMVTGIKL